MLGTEGVRLPSPIDGKLGRLKLELAKSKADDYLLSEEFVHPSLGPALPRGVEVIEGASGSITLLREPIRLQNMSIVLEPMGRVVSTVLESTPRRSLCLHPAEERVSDRASRSCDPVETSPGSPGLIPGDKRVSWQTWNLGALKLRYWSCILCPVKAHSCCWSV